MIRLPDPAPGSRRRWAIFVMGSMNFMLSMFYRMSVAVISPALVNDLHLTSSQLGDLSAAFFYAFALTQLPVGMAIDRLGSRITMSVLSVAAVAGGLLFALGSTATELIIGRALLGIGMSGNFMVVLALLVAWFPVDRFGLLSGLVVSVGSVGNLLAATPLALMSLHMGWRKSFLTVAAINVIVVIGFLVVIKDRPAGQKAPGRKQESLFAGFNSLFRMYSYWAISLANFVRYGYFAALQGLWAGPFLIYGLGMGDIAASNALLLLGLGYMFGLPISGSLSDRVLRSRKRVVMITMVAFCALSFYLTRWTEAPGWLAVYLAFFGLGFLAAPGQILYAHMKELLPSSMVAQALTAVNMFTILGAGVMTHVIGSVIGAEPIALSGPSAFCGVWFVGTVSLAVVCLMYSVVPDSPALKGK